MVHILDFPPEILEKIFQEINEDEFFSVYGSCKRFHDLLARDLTLHKCYRARYHTLSTEKTLRTCKYHAVAGVLHNILDKPWKARLVQKLEVGYLLHDRYTCRCYRRIGKPPAQNLLPKIRDALLEFDLAKDRAEWIDDVQNCKPNVLLAILLFHLPCLSTLECQGQVDRFYRPNETPPPNALLTALCLIAQNPALGLLSRLKHISLQQNNDKDGCIVPVGVFKACFRLPSLQSIKVRALHWDRTSDDQDDLTPGSSTVTNMHVGDVATQEQKELLEKLIAAPRQLKESGCNHFSLKTHGDGTSDNSTYVTGTALRGSDLLPILLQYHKDSLESLTLTSILCLPKEPLRHLNQFINLHYLDVDLWLLVTSAIEDDQITPETFAETIAKGLPRSLQHLVLRESGPYLSKYGDKLLDLLECLITQKDPYLPKWTHLDLYLPDHSEIDGFDDPWYVYIREFSMNFSELCREAAISLRTVFASEVCKAYRQYDWWDEATDERAKFDFP